MTTSTSESRLRQIAVLVASIDQAAARQLLLSLPSETARAIRTLAANLGPIPPEERRALLAEFQKSQAVNTVASSKPAPVSNSLLDITNTPEQQSFQSDTVSAAVSPMTADNLPLNSESQAARSAPAWTAMSIQALLGFVKHERPRVIAVIVHQLPAAKGVSLLQHLPRSVTREVLSCLGSIEEIDPAAMQAIDEHLAQSLSEYQHKIDSQQQSNRKINDLLAAAPSQLREQWSDWLHPHGNESGIPANSTKATTATLDQLYSSASITTSDAQWSTAAKPSHVAASANLSAFPTSGQTSGHPESNNIDGSPASANQSRAANAAIDSAHASGDLPRILPFEPRRTTSQNSSPQHMSRDATTVPAEFERILNLPPEQLAVLLSSLDSRTVLLALAGASPEFMKRFYNLLEPADARMLDGRLRKIGPVHLREIDQAQQRVLAAYQLLRQNTSLATRAA
ncbi:MAG: hypothetical protein KF752_18630 [Pirellulaceae bacterium]|nr:hypothetical protein [Pirellulaceae bacterium]